MDPDNSTYWMKGFDGTTEILVPTNGSKWVTYRADVVQNGIDPPGWELFIMYCVGMITIIFNFPVFFVVPRLKHLKASMRFTMINLALTDSLLGLESLSRLIYFGVNKSYFVEDQSALCIWDGVINNLLASVSILSLSGISLDKMLTIRYPIRYSIFMTQRKTVFVLALIWLLCFAIYIPCVNDLQHILFNQNAYICLAPAIGLAHGIIILIIVQIVPTITILVSFITIWWTIRTSQRSRRDSLASFSPTQKTAMQTITTLIIMSGSFYIMWLPFFTLVPYWELVNGETLSPQSDFVTCWLGAANSILNPIIYIPTITSYRKEVAAILKYSSKLWKSPFNTQCESESNIGTSQL